VKKILALMAAAALLLTGCSQIGAAATLGDVKITQATVQGSIDSILAERAKINTNGMQLETGEQLNRGQLRFHLLRALLQAIGKERKIEVTKADIDLRRSSIITQIGGPEALPAELVNAGIAPEDLDSYIEFILLSDKIAQSILAGGVSEDQIGAEFQKLIVATANKLGVTINPRYGQWDSEMADVVPVDPASSAVVPSDN
jgi:hypothetical protein